MVRICSSKTLEKIFGKKKKDKESSAVNIIKVDEKIDHMNHMTEQIFGYKKCFVFLEMDCRYSQLDFKDAIKELIRNHKTYFIAEAVKETMDAFINGERIERLKYGGYNQFIAADHFEKYGIFIYVSDLARFIDAPLCVKCVLNRLIRQYNIENVSEEIILNLKKNYPDKFVMIKLEKRV